MLAASFFLSHPLESGRQREGTWPAAGNRDTDRRVRSHARSQSSAWRPLPKNWIGLEISSTVKQCSLLKCRRDAMIADAAPTAFNISCSSLLESLNGRNLYQK